VKGVTKKKRQRVPQGGPVWHRSAEEATREAFASVAQRDLAQDFLAFWSKRTGARKYEPALRKDMAP
jgi:hypothetical protein